MSDRFKTKWFYASLDSYEKETGGFRKKIETIHSQRSVNFDNYAKRLESTYNEFDSEGFDVVNVVPMSMGQSESCTQSGGGYVGDVGFSITRGAVVVGKKRN